ncbi:Unknown protein sequence [Pseudomonas amygdali pv. sesami]|nr:Unknown protein sequence [Pseudomonas amygdali pv. sesami]
MDAEVWEREINASKAAAAGCIKPLGDWSALPVVGLLVSFGRSR